MGYLKGTDTSKWQSGKVDYAQGKKCGYEFVMLRIGYNTTKDPYFESDYARAKAAGVKIGIYYYATKTTEADAVNDANRVLGWLGSKSLDMPIAYDMEEASMKQASRKDLNAKQYNAFAEVIKAKGFVSMLYTGSSMFNSYFNKSLITDHIWIANYSVNDGQNHGCPNVGKQVAIHQYTSAAVASDFYTGKLDRNQMMISYEELMKKHSTNSSANSTNSTTTTTTTNSSSTTYTHKQFVKDVQTATGAKVDGVAGKETLSKTVTVSKTKNNKHAVVKAIQKYLNSIGFDCGKVDGIAGAKFDAAVKAFQKANGCVTDGEITAQKTTWKKLLKLS